MMLPHELRTPLNGILAYGEILTSDAQSLQPAEIAEMGQVIYHSGKRLEHLVENFLIYAQLEFWALIRKNCIRCLRKQTQCRRNRSSSNTPESRLNWPPGRRISSCNSPMCPCRCPRNTWAKIVDEFVQNAFKFSQRNTPVNVGSYRMRQMQSC